MSSPEAAMPAPAIAQYVSAPGISISIIIPALNEEKMIGRCLDSLTQLTLARDRFEVLVVDNGSRDKTLDIADSFRDRLNLRILQQSDVRISALRNLGAHAALGKILAFLDADCLAPADWLDRILALASTNGAGVLGAHYLLPEDSSWVGRTWHRYQEAPKSGEISHVPAGDLVMRREDFFKLGGFDEAIQTNEDYELCERARKAGMHVRAFPQIAVVHLGTAQSLSVFFRKQAWHGTHVIKVFLRDIFRSHNRNAVFFAVYTLLSIFSVIVGAAWTFTWHGPRSLIVAGLAVLCLPPIALSTKHIRISRRYSDFFPLFVLYLTYGIARAKALLNIKNFV
ncbi:MAG TPA: glycosyltransferase [Candidatus Angelobacter sp.]|jgi:glycosyltransferase involved in cell wall biosynthesis|nr:glycosyltransferase [Candidatus Angelobacter sp.]